LSEFFKQEEGSVTATGNKELYLLSFVLEAAIKSGYRAKYSAVPLKVTEHL